MGYESSGRRRAFDLPVLQDGDFIGKGQCIAQIMRDNQSGKALLLLQVGDQARGVFLRHRIEGFGSERAREVVLEHNKIFQAIKLRDVELAKDLLKAHIQKGKDYIFSIIFT